MRAGGRASAVRLVASGLHACGGTRVLASLADYGRRDPAFTVLTYHRVNDDADPFFPALPTEVFERQMAHLARSYRVLPLLNLVDGARRGVLPRNAVALTFDDGYRDNLTHVAPILARYGLPGTVFLATGFVGSGSAPWVDRLAGAFKHTRAAALAAPWGETVELAEVGDRLRALDRALGYLKHLPDDDLRRTLDGLLGALGAPDTAGFKDLMLSWDDVHALSGLGFAVGAHTVSHPILSRVSLERARREILGSRAMIETACGRVPLAFAYPNGGADDYTEAVTRLVQEAGFTCAVTTRFGVNTRHTSPWELRRGGPWEHHLPTFALKLAWYRCARRS